MTAASAPASSGATWYLVLTGRHLEVRGDGTELDTFEPGQDRAVRVDVHGGSVWAEVGHAHVGHAGVHVDERDHGQALVGEAADRVGGVGHAVLQHELIDVECDILGAGHTDLEIVRAAGNVEVVGRVGEFHAGDDDVATVHGDIDRGSIPGHVADLDLGHVCRRGGHVGNELRHDAVIEVARGDDGRLGAALEGHGGVDDDGALFESHTRGHDLDEVLTAREGDVAGVRAERQVGDGEGAVDVDIDVGRIRTVEDADLGLIHHLVLGQYRCGDGHRSCQSGRGTDHPDLGGQAYLCVAHD